MMSMVDEILGRMRELTECDDEEYVAGIVEAAKKVTDDPTVENIIWWWIHHGGDTFQDTVMRIAVSDLGMKDRALLVNEAFNRREEFDT